MGDQMNAPEALFDAARVENDWRTTPTDLGGWANRASAMFMLAKRYHDALLYIAGYDVAGYDAHMRPEEVAKEALKRA